MLQLPCHSMYDAGVKRSRAIPGTVYGIAAVIAAMLTTTDVRADRVERGSVPNLMRLEGYVGTAPTGVPREAHLVMQYQDKTYEFDLTKMTMITGSRTYLQVLQDVRPYRVNFIVRGTPPAVALLTAAEAGQKIVILGRNRTGSRSFYIDSIAIAVDPTPTTPP